MPIHKLLRGEGAERYLPFGLARARALRARLGPKGYGTERHNVEGFTVAIRHEAQQIYIDIASSATLRYEFFASEHVADSTLASPGHAGPPAYVCGEAVRARFNNGHATPVGLYSNSLVPAVTDAWTLRPCESAQDPATGLYTWRSWQNQKFFEHCWWPDNGNDALVTSAQAQAPGWANTAGWLSPYRFGRFGNTGSWLSDTQLDVRPSYYTKGGVLAAAPLYTNAWTWWRRAAVQSVGDRKFFICTDNFGRFQIYAVKEYGSEAAALPPTKYKMYTPGYPAWVSVPAVGNYRDQLRQWLWRFNKDATKCATVAFHSDDTDFLKYQTTGGSYQFCSVLPEDAVGLSVANLTTAQEDTPGLVELGISIAVTGAGDMDFEVTFSVLRESYFGTSGRFFFDAAYFLKDVEHPATVDGAPNPAYIERDCLVTAEIECRVPTGYFAASVSNAWASSAYDACRQMRAALVLSSNDADLVATERLRFTAFTPIWLQFPTIASIRDATANLTGLPVTFLPGGLHSYQSAGPGRYDPDSHVVAGNPWSGEYNIGKSKGFLYALELATLSACYEVEDEVTATTTIRGVAYAEEFYRLDVDLHAEIGQLPKAAPTLIAATEAVPSARAHQAVFNIVVNTEFGQGFSAHPAGHWAFNLGGIRNPDAPLEADLDWISVREASGARTRYRHKSLYNTAFAQARDYAYYHDPFTGKVLADYGSFRTAGFWVTFR